MLEYALSAMGLITRTTTAHILYSSNPILGLYRTIGSKYAATFSVGSNSLSRLPPTLAAMLGYRCTCHLHRRTCFIPLNLSGYLLLPARPSGFFGVIVAKLNSKMHPCTQDIRYLKEGSASKITNVFSESTKLRRIFSPPSSSTFFHCAQCNQHDRG